MQLHVEDFENAFCIFFFNYYPSFFPLYGELKSADSHSVTVMAATTHEEDVHVYMLTLCVRSNTCHQLVVFVIYIFFSSTSQLIVGARESERKKKYACMKHAFSACVC